MFSPSLSTLLYPVSLLFGCWDDHHRNPNINNKEYLPFPPLFVRPPQKLYLCRAHGNRLSSGGQAPNTQLIRTLTQGSSSVRRSRRRLRRLTRRRLQGGRRLDLRRRMGLRNLKTWEGLPDYSWEDPPLNTSTSPSAWWAFISSFNVQNWGDGVNGQSWSWRRHIFWSHFCRSWHGRRIHSEEKPQRLNSEHWWRKELWTLPWIFFEVWISGLDQSQSL